MNCKGPFLNPEHLKVYHWYIEVLYGQKIGERQGCGLKEESE